MKLETAPSGAAFVGMPYLGEGAAGLPSVPIVLPSGTVDAILDSGNDSTLILPLHLADELGVAGKVKQIGKVVSASRSQPVYEAQVMGDIGIGLVTLNSPTIRFFKEGRPLVGLPVLLQMTLAFDPTNGRTWVRGRRLVLIPIHGLPAESGCRHVTPPHHENRLWCNGRVITT